MNAPERVQDFAVAESLLSSLKKSGYASGYIRSAKRHFQTSSNTSKSFVTHHVVIATLVVSVPSFLNARRREVRLCLLDPSRSMRIGGAALGARGLVRFDAIEVSSKSTCKRANDHKGLLLRPEFLLYWKKQISFSTRRIDLHECLVLTGISKLPASKRRGPA